MTQVAGRIPDFDTWRPTYAGAIVTVLKAGTTTKAPIFLDEGMTQAADNPQVLETLTQNGVTYGKWAQPIYTNEIVELEINSIDQSGIVRPPLVSLRDEDASNAVSRTQRSAKQRRLIQRFNDEVRAIDFGDLGGSSATNTTTLEAAIGAAAGQGGGDVIIPPGTYPFTTVTLPQNVRLRGAHEKATTLQSQEAENVVTLAGDGAGLIDLTLDGVNLVAGSVGVFSKANSRTILDGVTVKRFETGIYNKGGDRARWHNFSLENCDTGGNLSGDLDVGGGSDGAAFEFNVWDGGSVSQCTSFGIRLNFVDALVRNNTIDDIAFVDNPAATAIEINGARNSTFPRCHWSNNLRNFLVQDDSDTSQSLFNTVIGLIVTDGYMSGGEIRFDGTSQDVIFRHMNLVGVEWVMQIPDNNILLEDSLEDINVTITGDGTKLERFRTTLRGQVFGITSGATATTAWAYQIPPGAVVYAEAKVIANQQDGEDRAIYHIAVGARRPGSQLNYDNQLENFVVGEVITGQTSGAQALIVADSDSGATGTLTLRDIVGIFENNEQITGASQGDALVNGAIVPQNAALDTVGVTSIRTALETDVNWNATFIVSGGELQLQVTGAAGKTVEWTVDAEVFSP